MPFFYFYFYLSCYRFALYVLLIRRTWLLLAGIRSVTLNPFPGSHILLCYFGFFIYVLVSSLWADLPWLWRTRQFMSHLPRTNQNQNKALLTGFPWFSSVVCCCSWSASGASDGLEFRGKKEVSCCELRFSNVLRLPFLTFTLLTTSCTNLLWYISRIRVVLFGELPYSIFDPKCSSNILAWYKLLEMDSLPERWMDEFMSSQILHCFVGT